MNAPPIGAQWKCIVFTPAHIAAALIIVIPLLAVAFFPDLAALPRKLPAWALTALPSFLSVPYLLVALADGVFRWEWLALYALLPAAIAFLLNRAQRIDPEQRGNWRDFLILATLGAAVDLRWLEPAWPPHLAIFNKMILLDAGVYGFLCVRQLTGVGFDLRLRLRDLTTGLREFVLYTPIALALGLGLGFLHLHSGWPGVKAIAGAWIFTFFFIAIPEELFFRGALQRIIIHLTKQPFIGIVITGILFSALHFQFEGFLPRMLLGMILGFFYWYSGSIWTNIAAHFVNNAVQVLAVSYMPKFVNKNPETPLLAAMASAVAVWAILWFYQRESTITWAKVYKPNDLTPYNQFLA